MRLNSNEKFVQICDYALGLIGIAFKLQTSPKVPAASAQRQC